MDTTQITADYEYCESIIKKHSKSFYYAFSNLPMEKANAVYAIYAFCRMADNYVDDNPNAADGLKELNQLHHELTLFDIQKEPNKPLWRALRHVFNEYDMEIQPFYDQLAGQLMDINFTPPKTMEQLEQYSYYVAGSVGLMLLPIIASKTKVNLKEPAIDLGIAMQLTNILRDIGEDFFEKQRIYLPTLELERANYSKQDLENSIVNESFIQLWEHIANRAEELYDQFLSYTNKFDTDSQIPVSLSAELYRGILDAVRNSNYNCISKRNYMSKYQMNLVLKAMNSSS